MNLYQWDDMPLEPLNPTAQRKCIHADTMTVAELHLAQGAVVPRHNHVHEQLTMVRKGKLRFFFDDQQLDVAAGEVLQIPSYAYHKVEALDDSIAVDIFSPVREDWRSGDDAYLRQK
ncbi:MAG TPA: cupin domain-containing protein [Bryobacteraceae bacterium]|nr:cupin domain-containing protein [Bryobacteraceae bacterium]